VEREAYLEELQRSANGGFDFRGQIPELAQEISADIQQESPRGQRSHGSTARQCVRQLVDRWLNTNVKNEAE